MKANLGMYYTIYKITNKINNKTYIGKHQTKDLNDGYMGSGKLLKRAIAKHGIENFEKQILYIFDNEAEMNAKEKELVVVSEDSYNLCEGGKGGFSYINRSGLRGDGNHYRSIKLKNNPEYNSIVNLNISLALKNSAKAKLARVRAHQAIKEKFPNGLFYKKTHSDETKHKMSQSKRITSAGKRNSQYGTSWVTNGSEIKKVKVSDIEYWVKLGYSRGRTKK